MCQICPPTVPVPMGFAPWEMAMSTREVSRLTQTPGLVGPVRG